jgi:hypothetical protein
MPGRRLVDWGAVERAGGVEREAVAAAAAAATAAARAGGASHGARALVS